MSDKDQLVTLLKRYVEAEDAAMVAAATGESALAKSIVESKRRVLKRIELHRKAEDLIELEVSRYREELYQLAKNIAKNEMDESIITESHVIRARQINWRSRQKYSVFDVLLTVGALLLGTAAPEMVQLFRGSGQADVVLLFLGLAGALLLGMGIVGKVR